MWSLLNKIDAGDTSAKPHFTSSLPPGVRKLADDCLAYQRDARPTFSEVLKRLESPELMSEVGGSRGSSGGGAGPIGGGGGSSGGRGAGLSAPRART